MLSGSTLVERRAWLQLKEVYSFAILLLRDLFKIKPVNLYGNTSRVLNLHYTF